MAVNILNSISFTLVLLYCGLHAVLLHSSRNLEIGHRYVLGTSLALVILHIPGIITVIAGPERTLCDDPVTRASGDNGICNAQGNFLSFSCFLTLTQ